MRRARLAAVVAEIRTGFHARSHADANSRLAFNIKLKPDDAEARRLFEEIARTVEPSQPRVRKF